MKQYGYKINGNLYNATMNDMGDNIANVEVSGILYKVELDASVRAAPKPATRPAAAPKAESRAPIVTKQPIVSRRNGMKPPLPGVILDIEIKTGGIVKRGQTIIILEAVKMENSISANRDGEVAEIKINKGDSVLEGTDLVIIE